LFIITFYYVYYILNVQGNVEMKTLYIVNHDCIQLQE